MTSDGFHYLGNELDVFATATNWREYWTCLVKPFIGGRVLEVGAGIGSATRILCQAGASRWIALEPDPDLRRRLHDTVATIQHPIEVRPGTVASLGAEERFDAVLYIDVLEHIEDDGAELLGASRHLAKGGHLIVLSPAHQFLFTAFDKAIGHYRRYDRASLSSVIPAGLSPVMLRYLDSVGMLASLANRLVLRSAAPSARQIAFWDGRLVPPSRWLDPLLGHRVGKSILGVWRRDGDDDATGRDAAGAGPVR